MPNTSYFYTAIDVKEEAMNRLNAKNEAKAMRRSPYIFALQDEEAAYFQRLSPTSTVFTVYGSYKYQEQPCCYNQNILFFSGNNVYNVNGLKWFLNQIFPTIIRVYPDVKLIVGGGICKALQEYKLNTHIQLYGFVGDPKDFFMLGDIAINPTYQGTGLKIKTFESLSYGKVVMVHPHSMIGIFQSETAPIFASEKAEDWVNYINSIWKHPQSIIEIKKKDKAYLDRMNDYILNEYKRFLSVK